MCIMKTFYTYVHRRKDTNEIFYVGIGTLATKKGRTKYMRAGSSSKRNIIWKRIVKKAKGFIWEIIFESESQFDVKQKEIELIKLYGRLDIKTGILSNMRMVVMDELMVHMNHMKVIYKT